MNVGTALVMLYTPAPTAGWLAGGVRDPRGPEVTRAEGEEAPQPGRDLRQVLLRLVQTK